MKEEHITIIGIAHNAKTGAVVLTASDKTYYIEGIEYWDEATVGKKLEVSGILKKEMFKEKDLKDETGAWTQGMVGENLTILNPIRKIINN